MSSRYAATTEVPIDRSRGEIERIVTKHGATSYVYGWQDANAVITFDLKGRRYRFHVPLPDRDEREFNFTEGRGTRRSKDAAETLWTQACRARWRALARAGPDRQGEVCRGGVSALVMPDEPAETEETETSERWAE